MQQAIERVLGFHDTDAQAYARQEAALAALRETFRRHGFAALDVPVVEHLELYVRKNGAQVLSKLYDFVDQGKRELALRPEFTASIIRAVGGGVEMVPEPLRVAYAGPVFRYEKPQHAAARQFTQAGVELLGAGDVDADAEILGLACRAARDLGVPDLRLVIGHLGPLRALLAHLGIDGNAEQYLLEHLEYYSRGGAQQQEVRRRLGLLEEETVEQAEDEALSHSLAGALHDATAAEARGVVAAILDGMGLSVGGSSRTPDEIIDRVLAKAQRRGAAQAGAWRERMERALAFIERIGPLRGHPDEVMPQAEQLLAEYDVPPTALDGLRQLLPRLKAPALNGIQVELAPGMARGIAYYSGLIFELYADQGRPEGRTAPLQICGGGRYDGLALALTGRRGFPALGFSFDLERLLHALPADKPQVPIAPRVAILISATATDMTAQRFASSLRSQGIACVVRRSVGPSLHGVDDVRRAGYDLAAVLPEDHHVEGEIIELYPLPATRDGAVELLPAIERAAEMTGDAWTIRVRSSG